MNPLEVEDLRHGVDLDLYSLLVSIIQKLTTILKEDDGKNCLPDPQQGGMEVRGAVNFRKDQKEQDQKEFDESMFISALVATAGHEGVRLRPSAVKVTPGTEACVG